MLQSVEGLGDWDRPIYGAAAIGAVVNLTERQAYHALERGLLDGDKFGRKWRSTKRRLLKPATTVAPADPPQRTEQPADTASSV
jgi:hypothetical protein